MSVLCCEIHFFFLFSDLGVGLKKIAIRLFFNRKDMNIFKQNVTGIPAYRTTLVTVPVLGETVDII